MFGALLIAPYPKERREMTSVCPEMFRGKTVPSCACLQVTTTTRTIKEVTYLGPDGQPIDYLPSHMPPMLQYDHNDYQNQVRSQDLHPRLLVVPSLSFLVVPNFSCFGSNLSFLAVPNLSLLVVPYLIFLAFPNLRLLVVPNLSFLIVPYP
jgi:hypothetical protein